MENKTCLKPPTRYPPVSSNVAIWKFPILIRGGFDGFDGKIYKLWIFQHAIFDYQKAI